MSSFHAVTWNVLAQGYITPERYRGVQPLHLEAAARQRLQVSRVKALGADLFALQEVDAALFAALSAALPDHAGLYEGRRDNPDGLAVFYRRACFHLEHHRALHYAAVEPGRDHLAQIVGLSQGTRRLLLANTHLRWMPNETPLEAHQGVAQLQELLSHLSRTAGEWCWLLAGDLNAGHDSPVLAAARRAGLALSAASLRPWDTALINGNRRKLDYLLVQPERLRPSPRPLPALSRDRPIPSAQEPSDHLPLQVDFAWC